MLYRGKKKQLFLTESKTARKYTVQETGRIFTVKPGFQGFILYQAHNKMLLDT
jgi:hypothetical protein